MSYITIYDSIHLHLQRKQPRNIKKNAKSICENILKIVSRVFLF